MEYRYIGDGVGVPGLPREITEEQISQMNKEERKVWQDALANGLYETVGEQGSVKSAPAPKKKTKGA